MIRNKIHSICESVRDEYLLTALEENVNLDERNTLRIKKFLNESLTRIEKMLVEEGYYNYGRQMIEETGMKFVQSLKNPKNAALAAAGVGAAGLGYEGYEHRDALEGAYDSAKKGVEGAYDKVHNYFTGNPAAPAASAEHFDKIPQTGMVGTGSGVSDVVQPKLGSVDPSKIVSIYGKNYIIGTPEYNNALKEGALVANGKTIIPSESTAKGMGELNTPVNY